MRKYLYVLGVLSLLLCIFFIQESFAKYITSANQETTMSIARWKILVNNEDIRDENNINTIINPIFPGNDNIAPNIIAPTSEGYFDLVIDAREADVSFNYKIEISNNENSIVPDLIATKYIINDGEEFLFENGVQVIDRTVLHRDNTDIINVRIFIKWDESETSLMDNTVDTLATVSDGQALINVNLTFKQVV